MFELVRTGAASTTNRLLAPQGLNSDDFGRLAVLLDVQPRKAHKIGLVAARKASRPEEVVTNWNGVETRNTAQPGDFIVTNLSARRSVLRDRSGNANVYVIRAASFHGLYESDGGATEFGEVYRAKGSVEALYLSGGFEILAPWGEVQSANRGYILRNSHEVYGNNRETFDLTYVLDK